MKRKVLFTLFKSPIGYMGIAWTSKGISRIQLPEINKPKTRERLIKNFEYIFQEQLVADVPAWIYNLINKINSYFQGECSDFLNVPLDYTGITPFRKNIYQIARSVGFGGVISYSELAKKSHCKNSARAVGNTMAHNPYAIIVPCHRVLKASKKLGGFSAYGGRKTKAKLLNIEGINYTLRV